MRKFLVLLFFVVSSSLFGQTIQSILVDNIISTKIDGSKVKNTYKYNDVGLISEEVLQNWGLINWENYSRKIYLYDINGNTISKVSQLWNVNLFTWENPYKDSSKFNNENNIIYNQKFSWNSNLNKWESHRRTIYSITT